MPVTPVAVVRLVITGWGGLIVMVRVNVPVPVALVAPSVTAKVPPTVGVPEMVPRTGSMANPTGKPVAV